MKNLKIIYATKHITFYSFGNIFKLSKNKYLFIYPIGEFKNRLINKDENINNILLYDSLNYIMIMEKENKEYILIYRSLYYFENNNFDISVEIQNTYIESRETL